MNCIWITTDSFRQDHVHAYRPEGPWDPTGVSFIVKTPNLDRLAKEAVVFDRMRAESLPTIPCRRAFFTGRRIFPWADEPYVKGLYNRHPGWRPLGQSDITLAEQLREQGFVTAMVTDTYHLFKPSMNFHRGFQGFHWVRGQEYDAWRTHPLPEGYLQGFLKEGVALPEERTRVLVQFLQNHQGLERENDMPTARTFRWAIQWLQANCDHKRFFLYIDTFSPHEPWMPPARFLDLYESNWEGPRLVYGNPYQRDQLSLREHHHLRARYAACCTMVDHWVGRLLDALDELSCKDDTLVVLVSDHGKIVGEFGHYGMPAEDLGPALADVPCMVRHPSGLHEGERFQGLLYNIDLTATVLGLLGVDPIPGMQGQDVWPALEQESQTFRQHLLTAYGRMVAVWDEEWLLLSNEKTGERRLYNILEDPGRGKDLFDQYSHLAEALALREAHPL